MAQPKTVLNPSVFRREAASTDCFVGVSVSPIRQTFSLLSAYRTNDEIASEMIIP